jgi:hypothetical protein
MDRDHLVGLGQQDGLLLGARGPPRLIPVEQEEMRLRVLRDEIHGRIDEGPDLGRGRNRGGIGPPDVEGFVKPSAVGGAAPLREIASEAPEGERDNPVPVGGEAPWGHGDLLVREPDGFLDADRVVEESGGDLDVLFAALQRGPVLDVHRIGEGLPFPKDVTDIHGGDMR